jgi:hypothetical protein
MRTLLPVGPLTLAASLLGCQDGNGPNNDPSPTSVGRPSAEVFRTRFFHDAAFIHTIPENNVTFTIGLVTPIADLTICGGSVEEFESDLRGTNQVVVTPPGPEHLNDRSKGTFVLYDVPFDFEEFDLCNLVGHVVGIGQGSFTRTDNSITGVGPGMNAFGFMANAKLELTDGSHATFHAVVRQLFDGEEVTTLVHKVELKPTGN